MFPHLITTITLQLLQLRLQICEEHDPHDWASKVLANNTIVNTIKIVLAIAAMFQLKMHFHKTLTMLLKIPKLNSMKSIGNNFSKSSNSIFPLKKQTNQATNSPICISCDSKQLN